MLMKVHLGGAELRLDGRVVGTPSSGVRGWNGTRLEEKARVTRVALTRFRLFRRNCKLRFCEQRGARPTERTRRDDVPTVEQSQRNSSRHCNGFEATRKADPLSRVSYFYRTYVSHLHKSGNYALHLFLI